MRGRGGFIGTNVTPAASAVNSAASGVWTLREAQSFLRDATWPISPPGGVGTNLRLWLNVANTRSLFNATTGGSNPSNAGSVKRWEDLSGNGLHFTNDTSPPTLATNSVNGLPVVVFSSAGNQYLRCTTLAVTGSANRTVFVAGRATGTTSSSFYFALSDNLTDAGGAWGIANDLSLRHTGGRFSVFGSGQSDVFNIVSAMQNGTTSSDTSMWRNGVSLTASSRANVGAINTTGTAMTLASVDGPTGINLTSCSIGEVIVYASALTSSERAAVESYLINKWGIT